MKKEKLKARKLLTFLLTISLIAGVFLIYPSKQALAGGSLYLSPGSQGVYQGSTFYVSVRVNTGGSSVNAVQANLSYPTDKLDYWGVGYSGSAFEIQAESSGGGGAIRIARGTISAKSGDLLIGTITFRAKVSSGSAYVSFTSGSEAVKNGQVISATSGATYTFTEPAPPPKPKPKDTTAPKISEAKVSGIGLNEAIVIWKTNEKATSVIEYGPSKSLGIIASSTKLVTSHKIALSSKLLFPGTTYYYQIKSKDVAGLKVGDILAQKTDFKAVYAPYNDALELAAKSGDGKIYLDDVAQMMANKLEDAGGDRVAMLAEFGYTPTSPEGATLQSHAL